ncbi:uncharacterized protein N7496_009940 [Penicillium cataractarum]|uniref:TeaA receptor TeaR n=1 Tax=Penicillium cataractarum TaxID=2100454 RepID=A0A9W9V0E6_9EURO|nr:uncharacterized protein N7496_009940 [Penicillium cataractarum]KAJ5364227.1 hypothetical protein N7496_009940 [Penicillium cataractarum]
MAGVATAYSTDALTSSGGVDNEKWEFAVPISTDSNRHSSRTRNSHDSNSARTRSTKNRNSNGSRSSSISRTVQSHDAPYLNSNRGRRDPSLNRHGSDVGNARDSSGPDSTSRKEPSESQDGYGFQPEEISENWIHRDKLAKIESEELQQAAILFNRRMRAESKSSAGRGRSHDSHPGAANGSVSASSPNVEHSEPWPELRGDTKREFGAYEDDERKHWDLRRPEEIAADEAAASLYSNPGLRKSSSRIPISTASPVPLMSGRDSRGARSRAATDERDDDEYGRGRRASEPTAIEPETSTPSPGSRPGSRGFNTTQNTPAKKTPGKVTGSVGSTSRKTSAPPTNRKTSTARSRAVSGNNATRPVTRGGEARPPTAINRPEGDPPWLATMYKPDPRLPPDQQMLPTLARKMQQEQWEKEGRAPTTYDRNFAPLAVHPDDAPPVPLKTEEPAAEEKPEEKVEEPPRHLKSPEPPRPNTSTGYSTMPKVQDTPPMGLTPNPNWNPPVVTAQEPPKKEKGCGCCIVM